MRKFLFLFFLMLLAYTLHRRNRVWVVKALPLGLRGAFIPPIGTFIAEAHDTPKVREHEACHYSQWKELGSVNFYLRYFMEYVEHGYNNMPVEAECRKNESQYCQENYTTCYPKSF